MLDEGFAYILAKGFWHTVMSLSLTYGSPRPHPLSKPTHILEDEVLA